MTAAASIPLTVEGACKTFQAASGDVAALRDVSLQVRAGELLTILGPSGSGKTTLLKVIAGFELPERGMVRLGDADITAMAPSKRDIGMVFQNYALFPHMSVFANVAFPLQMRSMARREIAARVAAALDLVGLSGFAERRPRQLSGGQQQRVAFARAVVFEPKLLLLDEPFGALDRKLREAMQLEIRRLQRRLGITTVFITHDQEEALVLSDRIAVMNAGRIEQIGAPAEIYERPSNLFIADFVGESNLFGATVVQNHPHGLELALDNGPRLLAAGAHPPNSRVNVLIRPERLRMAGAGNAVSGQVVEAVYVGATLRLRLRLAEGADLLARLPAEIGAALPAAETPLTLHVAPGDMHLLAAT